MLRWLKAFLLKHYLVVTYLIVAILIVLSVIFQEDLPFLFRMIACLVVIGLYAGIGFLGYIIIRALFADHYIDKKSLMIACILFVILVALIPLLIYMDVPNITEIYLLAPLASWPCFLAIIILNINTSWVDRREKRKLRKQQQAEQNEQNA